jgi:PAS domain S-box-containing protein
LVLHLSALLAAANRQHKLSWPHPRALVYLAAASAMLVLMEFLRARQMAVAPSWSIAIDTMGLVLVFVIGAIGIAYWRGFKTHSLLFVSIGCIGSGLIDLFHVLHVFGHGMHSQPGSLGSPEYWSSVAARLYLAIMLIAGWRAAEGKITVAARGRGRETVVVLLASALCLFLLGFVFLRSSEPDFIPVTFMPQLVAAVTAILYQALLAIFLARGDWKRYPFQHWFILALILLAASATCLVTMSPLSRASEALVSDVLRVTAYGLVLAALLSSTSNLMSQASSVRLEQRVNELMQRGDLAGGGSGEAPAALPSQRMNRAGTFELELGSGRLQVNHAALQMFGVDKPLQDVRQFMDLVHPEDRSGIMAAFRRSRAEGVLFKQEYRMLLHGDYRWLESIAGVESVNGTAVKLLGYLDDISERVEAARALEASIAVQQQSNRDLQMFAHIVSHDLQEPLRMVSSFMTLLQRRYAAVLNDEAREFIQFAVEGTARMRGLLEGVLEYSRVQSGGLSFSETALEGPLREALANLSIVLRESAASIDIGPLPVLPCDAAQMMQLFQNLLSNAIKFRRPVPVSIRISARRVGERWVVDVEDNGIGIDPAHFQRIFQIFQRLHGREFPGTGVGLAVCNRIMERHGGRMEVTSQLGEGSKFSLCF